MAQPPASPPSSDIESVNRDARVGKPARDGKPDPGAALDNADEQSTARPEESKPL